MKNFLLLSIAALFGFCLNAQPVITAQPQDQSICMDTCAEFSITAVGTGMNYAWQVDMGMGFTSLGVNSPMLSLCDSISNYDSSYVRCLIVDFNGDTATSESAMITVDSCLLPVADFDFAFDFITGVTCFNSTSEHAESLVWLFGDGTTVTGNVTDTCYDYSAIEMYFVKLYAFNANGADTITKMIDMLAVEEVDNMVKVFPNPTQDVLNVNSSQPLNRVELTDLYGRNVMTDLPTSNQSVLSMSALPAGVYILRFETDERTFTKNIVKQ